MKEIWKDIKGYEGLYQVSNMGRIKSYRILYKYDNYERYYGGKILKPIKLPKTEKYAHYAVNLSKDKKHKTTVIHRIVAENFIPNPENKPHVNHIDFDTSNNSVENLEWCTPKENSYHSRNRPRKPNNPRTLIAEKYKDQIIYLYEKAFTTIEIGEFFSLEKYLVLNLLKRYNKNRHWKDTMKLKKKRDKTLTIRCCLKQGKLWEDYF